MRAIAVRRDTAFREWRRHASRHAVVGWTCRAEICTRKGACLVTTPLSMPSPPRLAEVAQAKLSGYGIASVVVDVVEGGAIPVEGEDGLAL